MTWQYAGAYLVSVVTSPVILLAFAIGVLVRHFGGALASWCSRRWARR